MFVYYASDIKNVLVSKRKLYSLRKAGFENARGWLIRLDQISQVPEVSSYRRFDEVRYTGVSMVSTLDYLLDLL